jgi:hypothetical protein
MLGAGLYSGVQFEERDAMSGEKQQPEIGEGRNHGEFDA